MVVEGRQTISKSISKWYGVFGGMRTIKKNQAQRRLVNAEKRGKCDWKLLVPEHRWS